MEKIQQFLALHPEWAGVLMISIGVLLLCASIFDWNWIFGNVSATNYNLWKVDGIVNVFGRKTARFVLAILSLAVIAGGITWVLIYWKK